MKVYESKIDGYIKEIDDYTKILKSTLPEP